MDSSQQAAQLWSLEELAILETAGSGLAARSFWEQLRVAGSSWAAPSLGVALELFGVARSCSDLECSEYRKWGVPSFLRFPGSLVLPIRSSEAALNCFEWL